MGREDIIDVNVERFDEQVLAASDPVLVEFLALIHGSVLASGLSRLCDHRLGPLADGEHAKLTA